MDKDKLIDVVLVNHYGICPVCNAKMNLLHSQYTAYRLSPAGWITSRLDTMNKYTVVCPKCGYTCDMGINEYGLYPLDSRVHHETREPILKGDNPIGKDYKEK